MNVEIELVTDLDQAWPELVELFRGLSEHQTPLTGQELLPDWEERVRALFESGVRSGTGTFFVARHNGRAIGFANGHHVENASIFRERVGFIDNVFVREDLRGRGVASLLVDALERWLRESGVGIAELNVSAANEHALRVWEHLGYEPFSERRRKPI